MTRALNAIVLSLSFHCALSAQKTAPPEKSPVEPTKIQIDSKLLRKPHSTAKDTTGNSDSLSVSDAFANIVVPSGQSVALTSIADWTGADHVSIAIECPTSTSLQNTAIAVGWGVTLPIAPNYTATDVILGQNLLLPNMGGAVVPVYGNLLQLLIVNTGKTGIACDQVTVYGVVH